MQKKNDFQHLGTCHRLFNFIMNSLIGRGLQRVTLGLPMPKDSTNQGLLDEHAAANGEERMNSKLKDESDSIVQIQFKKTEELDYWTPVDKLGSSVHLAAKDDKAMENRKEFTDLSKKKETPLLNGISVGSTATKSADKGEKKKREGNKFPGANLASPKQPDSSQPRLTGFGLNINEISETSIQNTRERLSRNVSLMEAEES